MKTFDANADCPNMAFAVESLSTLPLAGLTTHDDVLL